MTARAGSVPTSRQTENSRHASRPGPLAPLLRIFALAMVVAALSFLFNNWLTFWRGWPGVLQVYEGEASIYVLIQLAIYVLPVFLVALYVLFYPGGDLDKDAGMLSRLTTYIIKGAFWAVLLVGVVDTAISLLRVEGFLSAVAGKQLTNDLGRSAFRGLYVHYPLIALGFIIALFTRTLGFYWLTLLVVMAEIQIVISRFVFSYEQAFMADLVRFWYGALFLFASAYTLSEDGHVRVDILYAGFTERGKAWTNAIGSLVLGLPLCWIIIAMGMWGKFDIITGPMTNYEVSQAGFGLYVKYLLAGFLLIYALTMLIQFMSYLLASTAILLGNKNQEPGLDEGQLSEI